MSQPLEHITEAKKLSHEDSETKSEEGSMAAEDDMFLSIQYPSPLIFATPYLRNQDFLNSERARKYITKHFNLKNIKEGRQCYPDLCRDIIYHNTFVDPDYFDSLQHYINKSICDRNAALQIWSEHIAR